MKTLAKSAENVATDVYARSTSFERTDNNPFLKTPLPSSLGDVSHDSQVNAIRGVRLTLEPFQEWATEVEE